MEKELKYPELPPGFFWRKPGEPWPSSTENKVVGVRDIDLMRNVTYSAPYSKCFIASVTDKQFDDTLSVAVNGFLFDKKDLERKVQSHQEGLDYIAALVWMGELS